MLIEAIILLSVLMLVLSVGLLLLKFVFFMVMLPLKLAFWLSKGLLGLLIVVPLLLVVGSLVLSMVPLGLLLLLLPVLVVGGVTCRLAGC
jgi:hypothetical protein